MGRIAGTLAPPVLPLGTQMREKTAAARMAIDDSPVLAPATAKGLPLPDAYVEWALQTDFRDVGGLKRKGWLSVMLE